MTPSLRPRTEDPTTMVVELGIGLDEDDAFCRVVRETGRSIEFEAVFSTDGDPAVLFSIEGADPDQVRELLVAEPAIEAVTNVGDTGEGDLYDVRLASVTLPVRVVDLEGSPRRLEDAAVGTRLVVHVPDDTDVRQFVNALATDYPSADLRSRRDRERPVETRSSFRNALEEELTPRQREALRTAYLAGYFEWPRERSSGEVASLLGISQPTFNRHLRVAERTLLSLLYEDPDEDT